MTSIFVIGIQLLTIVAFLVTPTFTASFFGDSYASVPFQDASSSTNVFLRFKTRRSDALLFLALGPPDYCLVILEEGEIKVRINLGSGEEVLTSLPGLKFDDLLWHEAKIHRVDGEVTLVIDEIHKTFLHISGRFFELNIKSGIFLGQLGSDSKELFRNIQSFRGCLESVIFNEHDVLRLAAESLEKHVFGVTWDCREEFEASSLEPISFIEDGAFIALPTLKARNGGNLTFEIKTHSQLAVLLYNAGDHSETDFVAVEIVDGFVILSVNEGNGVIEIQSDVMISDGEWHYVEVDFSSMFLEIEVDGKRESLRPSVGQNRFFDLDGFLYIGGIEKNKQSRALQQGIKSLVLGSTSSSLGGCLQNIKLNDQQVGLQEVQFSLGIKPGCVWEYPCLQSPCISGAHCLQDGLENFRCVCDKLFCINESFTAAYKLYAQSLPIDVEILAVRPLNIAEGGSSVITSENIKITVDFHRYGITESYVIFHIVNPPKHGFVEVEIWKGSSDNIFTLSDLISNNIRYTHDDTEHYNDQILFNLEFRAQNFRLPPFLEKRQQFLFHIIITPVNDPPKLKLSSDQILRLPKHTKKTITRDILQANDPDSKDSELVYTVVSLGSETGGFFENANFSGEQLKSFTQELVNQKLINYVHRGTASSRIALQISDGIEDGQTAVLKIEAFELILSLVKNTGIELPYKGHVLITTDNLTFTNNSPNEDLSIRYNITNLPQFGNIQKRRSDGLWKNVNHFNQRQINKSKIRYIHISGKPSQDEFRYTVTCEGIKIQEPYSFYINFINVSLKEIKNEILFLNDEMEAPLTMEHLKYQSIPAIADYRNIIFTIRSIPKYGVLYLIPGKKHKFRHNKKLQEGAIFTQADIESKYVFYKLIRESYSSLNDSFTFEVNSFGTKTGPKKFSIQYRTVETSAIVEIKSLTVVEGGKVKIGKKNLHIYSPHLPSMIYNVTAKPQYGVLKLLLEDHMKDSPSSFTSVDLQEENLLYVHDDSEHDEDSFQFMAYSQNSNNDAVLYGTLHIEVIMKNDNPPVRTVEKPFLVQTNGEKKLTGKYLQYKDKDIDSSPAQMQYTRRAIPNGALYHIKNPSVPVFQFTQEDLNEGKIIFRHSGELYGKTILWITDGQFFVTGVLEIEVSEPFIELTRNTGSIVRRGKNVVITSQNLSVKTNGDFNGDDVRFKIASTPKHGHILVNGKKENQFTSIDIENGNVEYEHDNSFSFSDVFGFVAFVDKLNIEGNFSISIYPDSYWDPLKIVSNKTLHVNENKRRKIGPAFLNIAHTNVNPMNIEYTIRSGPFHGQLKLNDSDKSLKKENHMSGLTFTQADINEGLLMYVQTKNNVTNDSFCFDVTNGVTSLQNLTFMINIISKIILLKTGNITVAEGKLVALTEYVLDVANPYFAHWISDFLIIEPPRNGHIINVKDPGNMVMEFSLVQLKNGLIHYRHDDSETTRDWFTVVGRPADLSKESAPSTIHVRVTPINDEVPYLVNNTGLEVWEGSSASITSRHLAAADDDSEQEVLTFEISVPRNGYISLKESAKTPIVKFTQAQINRGMVIFVHTGERAGGFRFQVNDGLNKDSPHVFTITARELKLEVKVNVLLRVLPRMQQSITQSHLLTVINNKNFSQQIVYHVRRSPQYGKILLENHNGSVSEVFQFTQNHVNNNMILYEHAKPMADLKVNDTVLFDIETEHASPLKDVEFHIEISVGTFTVSDLQKLVVVSPVNVEEGGNVSIGKEHVNLQSLLTLWEEKGKQEFINKLKLTVEELPKNGWLAYDNKNITQRKRLLFNHDIFNKNLLTYYHDHSESLSDNFTLGFFISVEDMFTDILPFNKTLYVKVSSANDHAFNLLTKSPTCDVVRGQRSLISSRELYTEDEDGLPNNITYEITSNASNGVVVLGANSFSAVEKFTQADIDKNLTYFVHDGSNRSGMFRFKVSDGKHQPVFHSFHIRLIPLSLELLNNSRVEILQGSTVAVFQPNHLSAVTNGDRNNIWYNITSPPMFGRIFLGDNSAHNFTQHDIDINSVFYTQMDMTVSEDYFTVSVFCLDSEILDQIIDITVIPLVYQSDLEISIGSQAVLTLEQLDASKLVEKTGSNPIYSVDAKPRFGVLQRQNSLREKREVAEVNFFTHEDIVKEQIIYKILTLDLEDIVTDIFYYTLNAPGVQPARGHFEFIINPQIYELVPNTTEIPLFSDNNFIETTNTNKTVVKEEDFHHDGVIISLLNDEYVMIICIIASIVVLALVVILISRCCYIRKKRRLISSDNQNGKVLGTHAIQTKLNVECMPSDSSLSLSDDLPPPVPPTSPSDFECHSYSNSPRDQTHPTIYDQHKNILTPTPSLRSPGNIEWTRTIVNVPMCKVIPLNHRNNTITNELPAKELSSDISDNKEWDRYSEKSSDVEYKPISNQLLENKQYWV
ncbi:chondroitin sulfate proteoglycan 4-like [Limulus polyphemus]|uniref:Chondroitin sulfate proteoglycan 4-like n=1 Tax=Limulus polyphemus TaxID=6850 RepID=A0ABM1SBT9_LIMPO|nr:chondroitin sulfate proteoglycan 4-like [Limulus polyphemus]XP_022241094.1 chondroitin sulfate proteoglycan 4-like [Limulus polyphemus]